MGQAICSGCGKPVILKKVAKGGRWRPLDADGKWKGRLHSCAFWKMKHSIEKKQVEINGQMVEVSVFPPA